MMYHLDPAREVIDFEYNILSDFRADLEKQILADRIGPGSYLKIQVRHFGAMGNNVKGLLETFCQDQVSGCVGLDSEFSDGVGEGKTGPFGIVPCR
jgi:hypothetical protein